MDIKDYLPAAQRGMALLDTHVPNWENMVDTTNLDMTDTQNCVLAQVFPAEWFSDSVALFLDHIGQESENVYEWAVEHGFDPGRESEPFADGIWFRAIIARRGGRQ